MVESSDEPSLLERISSICGKSYAASNPFRARHQLSPIALADTPPTAHGGLSTGFATKDGGIIDPTPPTNTTGSNVADGTSSTLPSPALPPRENGQGEESSAIKPEEQRKQVNIAIRIYACCKTVLFATWLNVLLVFVPAAIAVEVAGVDKNIVFAINAIAIVPLAGLLSYATESVAAEMGDTIGALMNVTFGNAVELIIFMYVLLTETDKRLYVTNNSIALTKNELRIVQASILGSILANLLLILGMCFLLGGLRFREQIYNNTVTQMSACLLSLSVMSLLLPTAFHASFTNSLTADVAVLRVSRGTSVILLLVYVLYLLFQLKSHAYMYQSTPQHVIDEESHPGVLADMLNSSSSSDVSTSSGSDSSGSSGSNTTAKRIRRVLKRGRRRRKSSASSNDTPSMPSTVRTPSASTFGRAFEEQHYAQHPQLASASLGAIASGDEADDDGELDILSTVTRDDTINTRDFENEKGGSGSGSPDAQRKMKPKNKHRKQHQFDEKRPGVSMAETTHTTTNITPTAMRPAAPCLGHKQEVRLASENSPKRPFNIRGMSVWDVVPTMPPMPKVLAGTVFSSANPSGIPPGPMATIGVTPRALHRSHSLPSRLNQGFRQAQAGSSLQLQSHMAPVTSTNTLDSNDSKEHKKHISRTAAVILLVISTGLVAVCAEFLVSSIDHLVDNTSVSEAFIGLIILPIIGNAAEHVCAVTVATKNKMDLAIGVAVGSSIQIALFVTPVIVLLGWILQKEMTLYFSLFETISLFVSAFIVNFLVLDGRSNYLEGALLIAAYVIIAVAAFFYPDSDEQSTIGGA